MAENILEKTYEELREIPVDCHMCCPKISDDDEEDYDDLEEPGEIGVAEKEKRIADGKKRLELLYDCSLIIGLPAGSAPVLSDEFARRSNAFLRACSACVRNWHKGRRPFLKRLSEFYDDTVIAQMADRLNDFDFDRITKGLEEGRQFIIDHNGIVDQRTFTEGGKIEMLIALFEALCCMPYLSLPDNRRHFNYIFEKIQERKILKLAEVLPTMTYFLFDENPTRNKFAVHTWSRQTYIPPEDFEWAVKDNLANAILKVNDMAASLSQIQLFWQGFLYILKALDENLIVHSLRAMNVQPDIYELMLQHMMVNSDRVLALLIRTFCSLLQKSPKAFWGAFGNYSHIAIAEQVFRSPAYKTLLRKSSEQALGEGAEATSWVRPFVESIPTHQKYVVCDSLVRHLLEDGKDPGLPQEGQLACYRAAAETLSSTLTAFASPNYKLTSTTAVQAHETLNLTLRHKDLVIQLAKLPPTGWQQTALSQAGLSAIRSALALDSRIISEEFNAIHLSDSHVQHAVDRNSSGLWDAFLEILVPGANELAKAMLGAVGPLITVEIFRPQKKQTLSPTRAAFNREFQKTAQSVGRMIERLSDFGQAALNQFCSDPATARPLIASLLHGEDPMNEAATAFIKTVADEERRSDAIAKLLSSQFVPVLASFTRAVEEINEKTHLWSPQFHIIRYSRDILDSLCDLSVGLLRSKTLTASERQVLANWWASQWVFLENAFNQTEAWSHLIETEKMKNFCREAMELADALLAQDGLIASALSQGSAQASLDSGDPDSLQAMKDTLEQPRQNCMGLVRMLRLKDLYLVTVIVSVLGKLLRRLAEHSLDVPHKPLTFIRQAIIKNSGGRYDVPTNLNDQQRAELIRALGEDEEDMDDDIQILSIKKAEPKKQTRLDAWSKSAEELSGAPRGQRPTPSSTRDDLRNMLPASSSEKNRSVLDQMRARKSTKQSEKLPPKPDPKITAANIASIKEKRAKEAEEKRKRDAEAIARAKALRAPKPMVAGEGSGLRGLSGVQGKDHAPQKSEIMVHSSSEDEDDSDEDAAYLAQTAKKRGDDSKRIGPMKLTRGPVKKTKIQRSAKDMRARLIPPMDVLHQAILEWDIFHKGNDPPNGVTCSKVSDTYADPREYKQTFLPLLIYEAWRSFVTAKDESTNKPFDIKVVNRMSVDKFVEVSTAMPIAQKKDNFLSEGDIVLLSTANKPLEVPDEPHCLARIWRTQFKNGTFEISYRISGRAGPILAVLMPQAELFAVKITNMITIEREYASLESLQYYDLMPEILEAKPSPMLKFSDDAVNKTMQNYHLNQGQAKAILNAKENDAFTLVQGPPGTGKTKTIVAMVGALLTGNFAATTGTAIKRPQAAQGAKPGTTGTTKKLLVCAPSNAAVDELVLRLKAGVKSTTGSFHKINVLRLGKSDAINAGVKDVTLDELIKARVEGTANQNGGPSSRELIHKEAGEIKKEITELRPQLESARASENRELTNRLQRQFDELKRRQQRIGARIDADKDSGITAARENELRRRQIQQEILDSAQVLCATLSGSGHEMFKNLNVEFETVIIDEAAQCVELSALIPLKYGCSKCILVGDPKQLPPTVLSQSAARFGYDQSLFVRMQRNQPDDVHLLDTQYRMHPEISLFPSQEFYERKLLDGDDMRKLRYQPWHQSALLGPYRFFDVKGAQERGHRGQSLVNYEELKVAMQIYERFRTDYPSLDLKGKIGIITPYKAQLYELRDQFSRRYGENIKDEIEFNTTDAFQGRECEIIIFSCVRASPTGGIGFMTDIRRMNVGLTRARSSLWILGDSRALVQGEFWNKLIENAKMRQQYTSGDVLSLLRKPGAKLPPPKFSSPETSNNFKNAGTEHSTSTSTRKVTPLEKPRDEQVDVVMEDAPPIPPPAPSNRQKTQPLPQTYTLLERPGSAYHSGNQTSYSTMNERGETVIQPTSDQRPVIHPSGQKRPREDNDAGKGPKRVASALLPGKRALPSAARPIPRPLDPAAMSVLGIPTTQPTNSSPAIRPPRPSAPHNAPKGPSNANAQASSSSRPPAPESAPQAKPRPPKKNTASMPFIQRKPNRPR